MMFPVTSPRGEDPGTTYQHISTDGSFQSPPREGRIGPGRGGTGGYTTVSSHLPARGGSRVPHPCRPAFPGFQSPPREGRIILVVEDGYFLKRFPVTSPRGEDRRKAKAGARAGRFQSPPREGRILIGFTVLDGQGEFPVTSPRGEDPFLWASTSDACMVSSHLPARGGSRLSRSACRPSPGFQSPPREGRIVQLMRGM